MEEESKTITIEGDPVDIRKMNEQLEKDGPTLELMEAALSSMRQGLDDIGAGLDQTLKEAEAAADETDEERREEEKIDKFAAEVASRHTR